MKLHTFQSTTYYTLVKGALIVLMDSKITSKYEIKDDMEQYRIYMQLDRAMESIIKSLCY